MTSRTLIYIWMTTMTTTLLVGLQEFGISPALTGVLVRGESGRYIGE